jgi:phosphoglucosamine mutase
MTSKLFGTDGIRNHVSSPVLRPENVAKLGRIFAHIVKNPTDHQSSVEKEKTIIVGRDTRASGLYLEQAIISGIIAGGVNAQAIGVVPTAAVAFCTKQTQSSFGLMISASHNPFHDNGIKVFDAQGFKISETLEDLIEHCYVNDVHLVDAIKITPGQMTHENSLLTAYKNSLISSVALCSFSGLTVVVDCAHGAAHQLAPDIFRELGCLVHPIGIAPNGRNINHEFGSEWPETIKREVIEHRADLGIAFDGDADRVIFINELGEIIDGDAILAAMAIALKKTNRLNHNTLVTTVMSSIALDKALLPHGIKVLRTLVGDKFVARKMVEESLCFGGENSGHIINFDASTTGDGLLSALLLMTILKESGLKASKLTSFFEPVPKLLKNIEVMAKIPLTELKETQAIVEQMNQYLKNIGRVLLRYSGTENKLRLLVEAQSMHDCQNIANEIMQKLYNEMNLMNPCLR